jgi:hypothetical protein
VAHLGRFERLQLVQDLWDAFAAETGMDTRPDVLDELASRATHRPLRPHAVGFGAGLCAVSAQSGKVADLE